jgi:hypothetical protein
VLELVDARQEQRGDDGGRDADGGAEENQAQVRATAELGARYGRSRNGG